MQEFSRRKFMGTTAGVAGGVGLAGTGIDRTEASFLDFDLKVRITFRSLVDAVVPETPELGDELGPEHVPGGVGIGLDNFMIQYVNNMFTLDLPLLSDDNGNLDLALPFVKILDAAAWKLVLKQDNEESLSTSRPKALFPDESGWRVTLKAGTFSKLSRKDRLRAISILDEFELELNFGDTLFELDAGMVGQLVIGFTEAVYYSEWEGYDEFFQPPSERQHSNDPADVQGWRQTDFPGFADGNAALRGFLGREGSELGSGDTWKQLDGDVVIQMEPGEFRENDYDTSDYEEPFPVREADEGDDDDGGWWGGGGNDEADEADDGGDGGEDGGGDDDSGSGGGGPGFTLPAVGTALGGAALANKLRNGESDDTEGDR